MILGIAIAAEIPNGWGLSASCFFPLAQQRRRILKPLAGRSLDFKWSGLDLAESGSTFNGFIDVTICLVFGDS